MIRQIITTVSFLIIALSLAYYFVIFIPNNEQEKLRIQQENFSQEQIRYESREVDLTHCLNSARQEYKELLEGACKELLKTNSKANCIAYLTGNGVLKILVDSEKKDEDECYKRYPPK